MARHGWGAQRELFAAAPAAGRLTPELRQALLALLETLLREVATGTSADRVGGNEQDQS